MKLLMRLDLISLYQKIWNFLCWYLPDDLKFRIMKLKWRPKIQEISRSNNIWISKPWDEFGNLFLICIGKCKILSFFGIKYLFFVFLMKMLFYDYLKISKFNKYILGLHVSNILECFQDFSNSLNILKTFVIFKNSLMNKNHFYKKCFLFLQKYS